MSRLERLNESLEEAFKVQYIEVVDESSGHSVPEGAESHFKVIMCSEDFVGLSKVRRHQSVYQTLAAELETGLHALSLHLYSPVEWEKISSAPESPACMGGGKNPN